MTAIEDLIKRVEELEREAAAIRNKPCNHSWFGGNPDGTGTIECEKCGMRMSIKSCDDKSRHNDVPEWRVAVTTIEDLIRRFFKRRSWGVAHCVDCGAWGVPLAESYGYMRCEECNGIIASVKLAAQPPNVA